MRMTPASSIFPAALILVLLCGSGWILAGPKGPEKGPGEGPPPYSAAELQLIRDYFAVSAGAKVTSDGKCSLTYEFESMKKDLADDWIPIEKMRQKVVWTHADRGSSEGASGVILSDSGRWFHNARWDRTVDCEVEVVPVAGATKKTLLAAVYGYKKGKLAIGNNGGSQIVKLAGFKRGAAIGEFVPFAYASRFTFGFNLTPSSIDATRAGSSRTRSESKKLLKKLGAGQVGLIWQGNVSVYVTKIEMAGTLDRAWVDKAILKKKKKKK